MGSSTDILVLPFFGQGHLNPCSELCKRLSSHNRKSILVIPNHLSSSIPSDLHHHPSVEVVEIDSLSFPPPPEAAEGDESRPGMKPGYHQLGQGIEAFLNRRYENVRPSFVVIDVMMSWSKEIFEKANVPFVSFFTTGACPTAMEYAASKAYKENLLGPDEAQIVPGLPEGMGLSDADKERQHRRRRARGAGRGRGRGRGGRGGGAGRGRGPRGPDSGPPGRGPPPLSMMDQTEGCSAVLLNTCDDLETPFIEYLSGEVEKPVFGVGPLLPDTFWESIGSAVHDSDSRPSRNSNYTEDEVIQWLDSKPPHSVIYISFGSEVGPTIEEYDQLSEALAETEKSFIWVIQPGAGKLGPPANMMFSAKSSSSEDEEERGYLPQGLEEKVGNKGLIIKGWAPQLAILSHPSTGGFLSHCGWNSTVEAICCGVPIVAWPIRGDQFYVANLVAKYLNIGHKVTRSDDQSGTVKKVDITRGIEGLMGDAEVRDRAMALRGVFKAGYPSSSAASLKALIEIISK